ncbi:hypothetical protein MTBBW1_600072 [Desulfamplus magnetovallimortis]|uniref:Transposase n=1 Tax=Desulfamplus magnetovallimortis TaxID=1246637 RepID=A0A1W1HIN6_9BACT|nr:hypothetical protein MTBBW1_600072 [Desulfamplus magnetovallimortis]
MLEFQSSDDYFMAVRIMTYIGLLYQNIIRTQNLKKAHLFKRRTYCNGNEKA